MKDQLIITIGREYGSAGHTVAERLAEKLGVRCYDRKFLEDHHDEIGYSREVLLRFDEKPVNIFASRRVRSHTNSIESHVQEKISEFIREKADNGESFVILGRCSDQIFRNNPNAIKIFILAHEDEKVKHLMDVFDISEEQALAKMKKHDKKRKQYHNTYSDVKWGDSRGYDICINSYQLGVDATVEILYDYVMRFKSN